jgi:hypothetical protein
MLLDRAVVEAIGKIREPGCLSARAGALARHSNGANQIHPGRAARWSDQILAATHDGFRDDGDRGAQHQALRIAIYLSFVFALLGVRLFAYSPVSFFWINRTVAGWTSIMSAIAILGAGEFLVLGIMGEYLGRVLREVRRWPLYIVAETEETLATRTMLVSADPR